MESYKGDSVNGLDTILLATCLFLVMKNYFLFQIVNKNK